MIRSINTWECEVSTEKPFDQSLFDTNPIPLQNVTRIDGVPLTRIRFTPEMPLTRYYPTPGAKIPGFSKPTEVIGWQGAILPGAPASLAAEFEALLQPAPAKPRARLRPTWRVVAVAGTIGYVGGTALGALYGWFW